MPNIEFKKGTARNGFQSTPNSVGGSFYESKKETTMQRLNRGFVDFNKSVDREPSKGIGIKVVPEASYDYKKAIEARTRTTKARVVSMADFDKNSPRDDILLQQTDMYKNVMLENTKEERELEIKARRHQTRNYPTTFLF